MPSFDDHKDVIQYLTEAQGADHDNRERQREATAFLYDRNGQWEQSVWESLGQQRRPRYTFDLCSPIVKQITGEIKKADFDIKVKPTGGNASKGTAKTLDGLIRNIENVSNAGAVYNHAAQNMVGSGMDGWMLTQEYSDDDSFDQDLFVRPVPSFADSVWFDTNSQNQDRSDSKWAFKLTALSTHDYEARYPEGSGKSVSTDRTTSAYWNKPDQVVVGEFYYLKPTTVDLVQMTNGKVFEDNEDFQAVADELAAMGVTEKARRKKERNVCYVRHFDGDGWLDEESKTVFGFVPLIPAYGNFNIVDNKIIYHGVIEKLLDPQRVHNYTMSRYIEEVALSPKAKFFMTADQAKGHTSSLSTMNIDNKPVQLYNHADGQPAPYQAGGAKANPALSELAMASSTAITKASGLFAASMGDNPALQSGVAIEQLQERGDTGTIDYFESLEIAISHTARVLVDAIPRVYDTERQVRVLGEDGAFEMSTLNERVVDRQSGQVKVLNDLSKGVYDVTCTVGKSFRSRQQETMAAILEMAQVDPSVLQTGKDIVLNSSDAAGMDLIAERERIQLLKAGVIPPTQWTDEEKQMMQQVQNQPKQPSPEMVLAQAEVEKAKAEQMDAQNKAAEIEITAKLKGNQQQIDLMKVKQDGQKAGVDAMQKKQEFDLRMQEMATKVQLMSIEQERKNTQTQADIDHKQASTDGVELDNMQKAQELGRSTAGLDRDENSV